MVKENKTANNELPIPMHYESSVCEIKNTYNELLVIGYIGKITDEFVSILPKNDELKCLRCNTEVKVNIFNSDYGFRVLKGEVFTSYKAELKIVNVKELVDHERRNFFRVDVSMTCPVAYDVIENGENKTETIAADIKDISLKGLRIKVGCEFQLGQEIWTDININEKKICYRCRVVRCVSRDDNGVSEYGCEFMYNDYKDADPICAFLFQKQREQLMKKK